MTRASRERNRALEIGFGVVAVVVVGVCLYLALNRPESEQAITPSTAAVGQCLDLGSGDGTDVEILTRTSCDEPHDGEIVLVTTASEVDTDAIPDFYDQADICATLMPPEDVEKLKAHEGGVLLRLLAEDVSSLEGDDKVVCYATAQQGRLTGNVL